MENTLDKKQLEEAFVDVRKSYRLLYLYQRRVMDLVNFIGKHYEFKYDFGDQYFLDPPKQWKTLKPDNWAWDFLLMNNHVFAFKPKDYGSFKQIRLMINIVSDTGCYDVKDVDKRDVNNYSNVEDAATQIHLILKTEGKTWKEYQHQQPSKASNKDIVIRSAFDDLLIGKKYDLSDFMNEESTLDKLKDFENFCSDNGIVLRPNK
jgi:hypothetical protein